MGSACFDGADALGLPCNTNEDCGQDQSCVMNVCGGPTSSPDTGASTSPASSSSSSGPSDSSTGAEPVCGNGVMEDGEQCDPGSAEDAADCDADCTEVECGDGYANAAAGEQCDDGSDPMTLDGCTADCFSALFFDDMDDGALTDQRWTAVIPPHTSEEGVMFMLDSGWTHGVPDPGAWGSGAYPSQAGSAMLISEPFTIPPQPLPPGMQWQVHFRHRHRFDGNFMDLEPPTCDQPFIGDGGVVSLLRDPMPSVPVAPPPDHPDTLADPGACFTNATASANPLFAEMRPRPVFSSIGPMNFTDVRVPLPLFPGEEVQLAFQVGYDCSNCWSMPPMGAGWVIDDVIVAPFPPLMPGG